jgi:hypothetical protein
MSKLKTLLQDQVLKRDEAGLSASSGAVIDALRKENPGAIKDASEELENSAMTRVLSQLAGRRPKDEAPDQPQMFSEYAGVRQFIGVEVERQGAKATEWKPIRRVTLGELGSWLSNDHKTETTRRQREPGMTRMFRDLSLVAQGRKDITVSDAMKLRRARGGK